ncbi:MAG TPA: Calx-beta domain-containing protein, partial [Chthoniobacteraceae bacterium]
PPPTISIDDRTITEGASGSTLATFTISLSSASNQPVTVQYVTTNGSATASDDYIGLALTTLTFAPGELTKTVSVTVNGDTTVEGDETFTLNLSNPINATLLDGTGQGTILNDDVPPPPTISIDDRTITEGASGSTLATFTISLSSASNQPVTVQYVTANGSATAPDDYIGLALSTLTFAPGELTKTVSVTINGDTAVEADETFTVNLSNPTNATLLDGTGQGTIFNDDVPPPPTISVDDASVIEGNSGTRLATFTISLSQASSQPVSVQYSTTDNGATAPDDYVALALTTLTFAPGELTKTVSVTVNGDTAVEGDELFALNLTNPTNATLQDGIGEGRILNDDVPPPPPTISVGDATVTEGASGTVLATFTISLSAASTQPISVQYVTGDNTATAPDDYVARGLATLTFSPGELSKTVSVTVNGDTLVEGDELFTLNLSSPTNATLLDPTGQGTILNDDVQPPPTISIADTTIIEGSNGTTFATFTIGLSQTSSQPVTVQYATANGSATEPDDYTGLALTTLTFAPGELTKTVSVTINDDTAVEGDETFTLNLSNPTNATLLDATGQGTILNDDVPPVPQLSIDNVTVNEGQSGTGLATFTVSLSGASNQTVTVEYSTADTGALAPGDYAALALTTLTFAPGELSKTVTVTINSDTEIEGDETFVVNLANPVHATLINTQGVGTILNDDQEIIMEDGGMTATIVDADGDIFVVKNNKVALSSENFIFSPEGELERIDLGGDQRFKGANITIETMPGGGGDGLVNLKVLDATGLDLGKVKISGNVGMIIGGDNNSGTSGIKLLKIGSLGTTDDAAEPLLSEVEGGLGKLKIGGDMRGAALDVAGKLGKVTIGGDLVGDKGTGGTIVASLLSAKRSLNGGHFAAAATSGGVPVGAITAGSVGSFTVKGSMSGGSVSTDGDIGKVSIGADLNGGAVAAAGQIKSVKVLGKIDSEDPEAPAVVAALGRLGATNASGVMGIANMLVRGDVRNAQILLGYEKRIDGEQESYVGKNADASTGKITINGNWIATSLVAGIFDSTGDGFGRNDVVIGGDTTTSISSRIASIVIKGTVTGTAAEGDHYAITAQELGKLSINGEKIALNKQGKDNILIDQTNGDFRVVEV